MTCFTSPRDPVPEPEPIPAHPSPAQHHAVALQQLLCHGVAQFHLPVQRVLLVVGHHLHQALKVGRGAQHEVPPLLLDSEVLHLPLCPVEQGHSWERCQCSQGEHQGSELHHSCFVHLHQVK